MDLQEFLKEKECFKFLKWIEIIQQENLAVKFNSMYILEKDKNSCELIFIDGNGNKRKVSTGSNINELKEYFPLKDLSNLSETDINLWKQILGGLDGQSATVDSGGAIGLNPGSNPTVTNIGTTTNAIFEFGIPKGEKGIAATINVGTVTTVDPGENASVENVGNVNNAIFNFRIPEGQAGKDFIPLYNDDFQI